MENYFSRLLSRSAASNQEILQPAASPGPDRAPEDILLQPIPALQGEPVSGIGQEPPATAFSPGPGGDAIQHVTQNKTTHYHYLQQYISRTTAVEAAQNNIAGIASQNEAPKTEGSAFNTSMPSIVLQDAVVPETGAFPPTNAARQSEEIIPALPVENHPPMAITANAQAMVPATLLLPGSPAVVALPSPAIIAPPKTPALTIGKILIEILPAKPVPPRVARRPSPFQVTGSAGRSGGFGFGLGQL
ncbi:hypothetical protein [Flavihumibacter fluvii]|uniref:hypothetical protein n=1 Tax=Flavihumibacter fluvii TaxID=2838157 RepID=UPI001BDEF2AA|nr:hypothetical protein [Flavihumibacter fluvii]ULQ53229.1 hypothetical protein KJS93_02730 [Flavihumibacter fluvii]